MKVFLCCEGPTDIGPFSCFIKKCANQPDIEVHGKTHAKLREISIFNKGYSKFLTEGKEKFSRIMYIKKLFVLAKIKGGDHIAYHQDAGHQGFKSVYDGIHDAFKKAVPSEKNHIRCLAIVPKEMIESWLLADDKIYSDFKTSPRLPPCPEELWGDRHNPDSNYPKHILEHILKDAGLGTGSQTYTDLAEKCSRKMQHRDA
jgi:hypothetical protein